jgi:EAL domain-containing protein (putative c-di-GMP-specific phosphodiesterase class I)
MMPPTTDHGVGRAAMQVLVLDDDPAIGRLVARIAAPLGFEVATATCSSKFRSLYDAELPDLIVLDLRIGNSDGVEELRFLSNKGYPNALVVMSGFDHRVLSTTEILGNCLGLKVVSTLTKPFLPPALTHVLDLVKAQAKSQVAEELLAAISKNQLVLEYQPIVLRRDGAVRRVEALIRWNHPKSGRWIPQQFMLAAEATPKVLDAVTDWTLATAIQQYENLRNLDCATPIAVNVSGRSLFGVDFPDRLSDRLRNAQIPTGHFCLEITESAVGRDPVRVMEILSRLRLKGVELAIDDFGTGNWSLTRFRQLPFSIMKIAGNFVRSMKSSPEALKTVESSIRLANTWGLETIAEDVDTEELANGLAALGISGIQGDLIAAPLPADQIGDWLKHRYMKR